MNKYNSENILGSTYEIMKNFVRNDLQIAKIYLTMTLLFSGKNLSKSLWFKVLLYEGYNCPWCILHSG